MNSSGLVSRDRTLRIISLRFVGENTSMLIVLDLASLSRIECVHGKARCSPFEREKRAGWRSAFLKLDLPDFIQARGLISIGEGGEQVYVEQYRRRVEERILKIVENHSTMAVIRSGGDPTDLQLIELERALQRELGGDGIELTTDKISRAYGLKVDSFLGFLRHVLDLDALPDYSVVVERSFARHIAAHQYSADQIRFLRAVQEVFLYKRQLELQDFYESPLTNFGRNAVDRLFTPAQVQEIIGLANQMAA